MNSHPSFDSDMRAYPSVVALAWGVPMFAGGKLLVTGVVTGGTSASAPAFAGVVSLLNALRLDQGLPCLGFLHPRLYQAAAASAAAAAAAAAVATPKASADPAMFFDVVVGNSSVGGDLYDCGNGFEATSGWDAVTGWGSPRWAGLVHFLGSDPMPV